MNPAWKIPIPISTNKEACSFNTHQKVEFRCQECGKPVVKDANRVKYLDKLLCRGCMVSARRKIPKTEVKENQMITSIAEIINSPSKCLQTTVQFKCVQCGKIHFAKTKWLKTRGQLNCNQCAAKECHQLMHGVDSNLQLKQNRFFDGRKQTFLEKLNTWYGQRYYFWVKNWDKRVAAFKKYGWDVIDKDPSTFVLLLRCECGFYKKFYIGSCSPTKLYCPQCFTNPFKKATRSKKENQFSTLFRLNFPNEQTILNYKGWASGFRGCNNYEIDLFLPDRNIGFEFNGIFWHDKSNPSKEILKSHRAKSRQIQIYHIWEDDWLSDRFLILKEIKDLLYSNKIGGFSKLCKY